MHGGMLVGQRAGQSASGHQRRLQPGDLPTGGRPVHGFRRLYLPVHTGSENPYILTVSCPGADESTPTIAGLLGIDLTGANLPFEKPGDVNGDGYVALGDAVLLLRMLSGVDVSAETILTVGDANGDRKIGLAEALFILQGVAGLRASGP